jgi:hypothetical protein
MIYGLRYNGNQHGTVLTRKEVVNFMLDVLGYSPSKDLSNLKVLDPSGGEGVFIIQCIERLSKSADKFNFNFYESFKQLLVVEFDLEKAKIIQNNIRNKLKELGRLYEVNNPDKIVRNEDFLVGSFNKFDVVVGNPPYVRHENIPIDRKILYREIFSTFRHRSDLYIAFYEKGLNILTNEGRLCYVCSNRWMKNKYGEKLKHFITSNYNIPLIINLEKANPFEEKVYGYASITLIDNYNFDFNEMLHYYECDDVEYLNNISTNFLNNVGLENEKIKHTILQKPKDSEWFFNKNQLGISDEHYTGIEDQGFKIGIGVATGADAVFMGENLDKAIEKNLLIPIISSKNLKNGYIKWDDNYLLNPYENGGDNLIDLDKYPKAKKYLMKHESILRKRYVAKKHPDKWFKTIDKIHINILNKPKILLNDISQNKFIALEMGNYYPHHNLYYITGNNVDDLKIVGAFLMSDFIKNQLQYISNLMHGGYVRWQSQNLRKLFIPKISKLTIQQKEILEKAFDSKNIIDINKIVNEFLITNS